jgi:hypothetical protein
LKALALGLGLLFSLEAGPAFPQSDFGRIQPPLGVEWQAGQDPSGRPILSGYVVNTYGLTAHDVQLLIETLDGAGQVVGRAYVPVDIPIPFDQRVYFRARGPQHGAGYRVTVSGVNWRGRGGGG